MNKAKPETLQELRTLALESEGIKPEDEKCFICKIKHDGYHFTEKTDVHRNEKEPITGERILKALGKKYGEWHATVWGDGVYKIDKNINWTLCQPAKEQSEEDLQKIIKLLKPKPEGFKGDWQGTLQE